MIFGLVQTGRGGLRDAVDHGVSDPFCGEEKQGQDGEGDLKTLGVELLFCHRLLAPLSGGLAA